MMEKPSESEGRDRQEKAAARFMSDEPSRDRTKKLMKTSKGLVYDGPVQVLIDLVEKPGIMHYSKEQLLKKCSEEASKAADSNTGVVLGPAGGTRMSIFDIIKEYGPMFARQKRWRKKQEQSARSANSPRHHSTDAGSPTCH